METFSLLIPGLNTPAGMLEVAAPFDGVVLAQMDTGDASHVETAPATALSSQRDLGNRGAGYSSSKKLRN